MDELSRRSFLNNSIKGSIVASVTVGGLGSFLASCSGSKFVPMGRGFTSRAGQSPLPYQFAALEPVIDARTMEIHYTKHAAGYSKKLMAAMQDSGLPKNTPVEEILGKINKYDSNIRNNAGGHYNHEMFWQSMQPKVNDNAPFGRLGEALVGTFGSVNAFKEAFSSAAKDRFGSGWAWLYADSNRQLKIGSTPNQDNPLMPVSAIQGFPLLGIDVWEHAYYLQYQNKRADYVNNWWDVVNWGYVLKRYEAIG